MQDLRRILFEGSIGLLICVLLWAVGRLHRLIGDVEKGISLQITAVFQAVKAVETDIAGLTTPTPRSDTATPERKK